MDALTVELAKLSLGKGDALLVRVPAECSPAWVQELTQVLLDLRQRLGLEDVPFMILPDVVTLQVIERRLCWDGSVSVPVADALEFGVRVIREDPGGGLT